MEHRRAVLAAIVTVGTGLTLVVTVTPIVHLAYENLALHVLLDTADALVAAALAYLVLGRFRRTRLLDDLLLVVAFTVFGAANLLLSLFAGTIAPDRATGLAVWTAVALRIVAASSLCAAGFVPEVRVPAGTARARRALAAGGVVGAVVLGLAGWADAALPELLDPALSPESASRPRIVGHPVTLASQMLLTVLFAAAAAGLVRRSARSGDELLFWLGAGALLRAFARFNYFLFPSLYSDWVYTGDILRLLGSALYVVGASREVGSYWRDQRRLAALEERRRLAREVHDGLSQELAFLRSQLAGDRPIPDVIRPHLGLAADRALEESRRLVTAFGDTATDLADELRRAAEEVALREGAKVELDVDRDARVREGDRAELRRIVREATANAVRHGRAATVHVSLRCAGDAVRLLVVDEGVGFDVGASAGFGLRSMAERAAALGGTLRVESVPGRGTSVEVVLPCT